VREIARSSLDASRRSPLLRGCFAISGQYLLDFYGNWRDRFIYGRFSEKSPPLRGGEMEISHGHFCGVSSGNGYGDVEMAEPGSSDLRFFLTGRFSSAIEVETTLELSAVNRYPFKRRLNAFGLRTGKQNEFSPRGFGDRLGQPLSWVCSGVSAAGPRKRIVGTVPPADTGKIQPGRSDSAAANQSVFITNAGFKAVGISSATTLNFPGTMT